jgi:vacuolar iron transporter family protein
MVTKAGISHHAFEERHGFDASHASHASHANHDGRHDDKHANEEGHAMHRAALLRAGVLGANDGLLSTASLVIGVAGAGASHGSILTAGFAGLVAGSLAMAVGEWSSVSSQRDAEVADLNKERAEILRVPDVERRELAGIYRKRGLSAELADAVAAELSAGDALRHHARDELGLDMDQLSRPGQAAITSAITFAVGAVLPVLAVWIAPDRLRVMFGFVAALIGLGILGFSGAKIGGAPWMKPTARVLAGGAIAMAVSFAIGSAIGTVV